MLGLAVLLKFYARFKLGDRALSPQFRAPENPPTLRVVLQSMSRGAMRPKYIAMVDNKAMPTPSLRSPSTAEA